MSRQPADRPARVVETIAALAVMPFTPLVRRWHLRWGATTAEAEAAMAGDELVPGAQFRATRAITIDAPPEAVWPWITQAGFGRAGFYSYDLLDNLARTSATTIDPAWSHPQVGDIAAPMTAHPTSSTAFTVADVDEPRRLVWTKPDSTWSWQLTPLDAGRTRLVTRLKVRYPKTLSALGTIALIEFGDFVMMRRMLLAVRQRATTTTPASETGKRDAMDPASASATTATPIRARDVVHAAQGVAVMLAAFATPMLRSARRHWGLPAGERDRVFPGDDLVVRPRWQWAHAIDIAAPAETVWPWVAQIGADRGGFYSYELLENLAGCRLHNADRVHPNWAVHPGDALSIHPDIPPLPIVAIEPGRWFVAHAAPPDARPPQRKGAVAVSWLFLVEPTGPASSRVISRYRCATADDLATRLRFGPTLIEPISFAMDRAMLHGIKARARP